MSERDPFDARIDAIARAMTGAEPRADFTARVMRQIAATRTLRSSARAWILVPAIAAAAVVLIAVLFHRPNVNPPATPTGGVTARQTPPTAESHAAATQPLMSTAHANPPAVRARTDRVTTERPIDIGVEPLSVQPMRLPALEPLDAAPPEALGIEQLSVAPLSIEGENR